MGLGAFQADPQALAITCRTWVLAPNRPIVNRPDQPPGRRYLQGDLAINLADPFDVGLGALHRLAENASRQQN